MRVFRLCLVGRSVVMVIDIVIDCVVGIGVGRFGICVICMLFLSFDFREGRGCRFCIV